MSFLDRVLGRSPFKKNSSGKIIFSPWAGIFNHDRFIIDSKEEVERINNFVSKAGNLFTITISIPAVIGLGVLPWFFPTSNANWKYLFLIMIIINNIIWNLWYTREIKKLVKSLPKIKEP